MRIIHKSNQDEDKIKIFIQCSAYFALITKFNKIWFFQSCVKPLLL